MLKILKFSENFLNHWFVCYSSSWRHQFKIEKPIYYPKRNLSEEDESKVPLQEHKQSQTGTTSALGILNKAVDYYRALGVNNKATTQEIKTAYYDLAKKYHPDAKPTPKETESFRRISEAYHVLIDENNRSEYDRFGMVLRNGQQLLKVPIIGDKTMPSSEKNKTKFFKEQPRTAINNGKEVLLKDNLQITGNNEIQMNLKFFQGVHGSKEYLDLKAMVKCTRCSGGAAIIGNQENIEFCPKCGGTGQYRVKTSSYMEHKQCEVCKGRRYISKSSCKTCENRGYIVQSKRIEVQVPPGTSNGDILKINNPLTNQLVHIRVSVDKSSYFKRDGNNIATDKYLTISQAVLGGKFKIRGLYEDLEVNLGPGTESHTVHCFKGNGIRTKTGQAGDHIVTFKIRIPKTLTTKQRQLMLALSRAEDPTF